MKTRYIVGLFLVGASVLSSCSDFTEIDQKGMNLLSTTDQLEMLLNQENVFIFSTSYLSAWLI